MFRTLLTLAAGLLIAACAQAPEDMVAQYKMGGSSAAITIKAAANGDWRVDSMGETLIRRGGVQYMIASDSRGRYAARQDDAIWVMARLLRERGPAPAPTGRERYELVQGGEGEVAGRRGTIWTLRLAGDTGPGVEAIVSSDSELAPIGRALAARMAVPPAKLARAAGIADSLREQMTALLAKGTLLKFGNVHQFESLTRGPINPADLALPGTVLDRAALLARTRAALPAPSRTANP